MKWRIIVSVEEEERFGTDFKIYDYICIWWHHWTVLLYCRIMSTRSIEWLQLIYGKDDIEEVKCRKWIQFKKFCTWRTRHVNWLFDQIFCSTESVVSTRVQKQCLCCLMSCWLKLNGLLDRENCFQTIRSSGQYSKRVW